jgi:cobalt-zinc-cadmium efflux system membrane fusion protein
MNRHPRPTDAVRLVGGVALMLVAAPNTGCREPAGHEDEASVPAHHDPHHVDEPGHGDPPRRVRLSPQVMADAGIEVGRVTQAVIRPTVELPGHVQVDPDRAAEVPALLAGTVDRILVKVGDVVKIGDPIASIRAPGLGELRSAVASVKAQAASARANAERLRSLVPKRLASEQEALTAEAQAKALQAQVDGSQQQLRAMGLQGGRTTALAFTVRAPKAGIVLERSVRVGSSVTATSTVATLAALDEVWFLAHVFEKDVAHIREGAQAEVELHAYPDERFSGQVQYIDHQVDLDTATLSARIPLANPEGKLRLGLFGTALVALTTEPPRAPTLVVPRSAITEIEGQSVVFVAHEDGDFEVHEVVLGDADPGRVEILHGLREGEQVVVEGAFNVKSAILRGTLEEGGH